MPRNSQLDSAELERHDVHWAPKVHYLRGFLLSDKMSRIILQLASLVAHGLA